MWEVRTFDVWGHNSGECKDHGCPCMKRGADDENDDPTYEHDENWCDCHYDINNVFRAGTLHPNVPQEADDAQLWEALIGAGFANRLPFSQVEFEDMGEHSCHIVEADTGFPVFGLEWRDANE